MRLHALDIASVYERLHTAEEGLSAAEAAKRLAESGRNRLPLPERTPLAIRFLANFTHLMALLLWVGGIAAFLAKLPQLAIAIWMVNIINGIFSFFQEYRAERATAALKKLLPVLVKVIRGGQEIEISAEEVVIGDVLVLQEGDRVPADARIVEENRLEIDQSTVTGESHPIRKSARAFLSSFTSVADIPNVVLSGTSILSGDGKAVVFATGAHSEFGRIAHLTQSVQDDISPLQKELGRVTHIVTILATGIGFVMFLLATAFGHISLSDSFVFSMGMIVCFVPEGMLPTVTLSLAMAVQRMAGQKALVKRLSAVETLGCTNVICTDKTGTLTKNEMTVTNCFAAGRHYSWGGIGYSPVGTIRASAKPFLDEHAQCGQFQDEAGLAEESPNSPLSHEVCLDDDQALKELLTAASLCTNARLVAPGEHSHAWTVLGDPTEGALIVAAAKASLCRDALLEEYPRTAEVAFDPHRKRMTTIHRSGQQYFACVKGGAREILELCTSIRTRDGAIALSDEERMRIIEIHDLYARQGLRVLGVARRSLSSLFDVDRPDEIETDLMFLGLMAMLDPPRSEIRESVELCREAGIRIIMITGDYGLTAESIARKVGIVTPGKTATVITGEQLDRLTDKELSLCLQKEVIFARTYPEQKLRVVKALQALSNVVAVTGDGVNDAPALKQADIGVAMGIKGTDVAREAADMILIDDNFATIVRAVEEGRAVYANIKKFAVYVFNSNMAEAIPFVAMLFSGGRIPLPLTVMQVLSIDLGTDMVPAIALGAERAEPGIMSQPPRNRAEPLLSRDLLTKALLWYGLIEGAACMSAYFFFNLHNGWPRVPLAQVGTEQYRAATTMTLLGVVATQIGAVLCCRTELVSITKVSLFSNRLIWLGIAIEILLVSLLMYVPCLQNTFNTAPLSLVDLVFVSAWIPLIIILDEARKALLRSRKENAGPSRTP
ncbi:MAG TPA: cation-transporting P-type ATPase [Candidatus Obscuribacterales bacterium]